jgi:hypothetical protein
MEYGRAENRFADGPQQTTWRPGQLLGSRGSLGPVHFPYMQVIEHTNALPNTIISIVPFGEWYLVVALDLEERR